MIREITNDDLPQLIVYGEHFWTLTPYASTGMEYNPETTGKLLLNMKENHYLRVAEVDGKIIGFLGILIAPILFNSDYTVGQEVFFFVHPEHRDGLGQKLLDQAEEDLKGLVDILAVGDMVTSTDMTDYYKGRGFTLTEQTYSKVL